MPETKGSQDDSCIYLQGGKHIFYSIPLKNSTGHDPVNFTANLGLACSWKAPGALSFPPLPVLALRLSDPHSGRWVPLLSWLYECGERIRQPAHSPRSGAQLILGFRAGLCCPGHTAIGQHGQAWAQASRLCPGLSVPRWCSQDRPSAKGACEGGADASCTHVRPQPLVPSSVLTEGAGAETSSLGPSPLCVGAKWVQVLAASSTAGWQRGAAWL